MSKIGFSLEYCLQLPFGNFRAQLPKLGKPDGDLPSIPIFSGYFLGFQNFTCGEGKHG